MKRRDFLKGILLGSVAAIAPKEVSAQKGGNEAREFHLMLSRYTFDPPVIKVKEGDKVRLIVEGLDLEHGLYIDGYDIGVTVRHAESKTLEFLADRPGAFKMRCSVVCGPLHPFMTGKFVVEPNNQFWIAMILSLITPFAALLFMHLRDGGEENG